ncbi:hypothetical protein vseg_010443 [Gypsophila vaccaria]
MAAVADNYKIFSRLPVVVTSREMIRPSTPTRGHNNIVHLSILDQLAPSFHNPMIWFYQNDQPDQQIDHSTRSMSLKNSLAKTLVHFYPLAGRTQGNVSIDCNDLGVEFCEAHVLEDLVNVIDNPCIEKLRDLLPFETKPRHKNLVLSVQVNHFSCGGMAISICISHKIADGLGTIEFLKAWSMMTRAGIDRRHVHISNYYTRPKFNGASFFPPLPEFNETSLEDAKIRPEKLVSKRLIFDKKKLEELKSRVNILVKEPTRVELVSTFLWKLFMTKIPGISASVHAVNLRTRTEPPIPEGVYGNFVLLTSTSSMANGAKTEYPELFHAFRKAIKKVDNEYLDKLLKRDGRVSEINKENENINHGDEKCCFTSLCRFPIYEVDFGMGKPIWACHAASPVKNLVVLWNTRCGRGIEAWIHMVKDDMLALELHRDHNYLLD